MIMFQLCGEQTKYKLILSVLTLILTSLLTILMLVIVCLFCCNTKAFGYKTVRQRRSEFYMSVGRETVQQEMLEQTNQTTNQTRQQDEHNWERDGHLAVGYHQNDPNVVEGYTSYLDRRERRPYQDDHNARIERGHIEPSAPPLQENDTNREHRDRRPHHDRNRPRRPYNNDDRRNRPREAHRYRDNERTPQGQRYVSDERGRGERRKTNTDNDLEAPPPSYNEVVGKYLKADDV